MGKLKKIGIIFGVIILSFFVLAALAASLSPEPIKSEVKEPEPSEPKELTTSDVKEPEPTIIEPEPETPDMPESTEPLTPFITTDKTAYSLGDTIRVSGFIDRSILNDQYTERLDHTRVYDIEWMKFNIKTDGFNKFMTCYRASEQWADSSPKFEFAEFYVRLDTNYDNVFSQGIKCLDDSGNFSFDFEVTEDYHVGNYVVSVSAFKSQSFSSSVDYYSQPFTVN